MFNLKITSMNLIKYPSPSALSPQGELRLTDDSLIPCYPLSEPHSGKPSESYDEEPLAQIFIQHIPALWAERKRILSDSRLFLCPIPIRSGVAYCGAFPIATLGAYIELWSLVDSTHFVDNEGEEHFVYRISGSPLSGNNRCGLVSSSGKDYQASINRFGIAWRSLRELIRRYQEAQSTCEAYSLTEALAILGLSQSKA